jgi:pSer/pThr/pTyr-binding forkhead associated (FHA) protein
LEKQWFLESFGTDDARLDFVITQLPCRIGRGKENDLVIPNLGLSRFHAVLVQDISGQIRLVDENSTNGTFVNRHRIEGYCLLKENDIIHFASAEFKLRLNLVDKSLRQPFDEMNTMLMSRVMSLSKSFMSNEAEFDELLMGRGLSGAVQPIVDARTRQIVAYEFLGRANHPHLPKTPIELFTMAESIGREIDLSLAFREFGLDKMAPHVKDKPCSLMHTPRKHSAVFFWIHSSISANLHRNSMSSSRFTNQQ